MTDIDDAKLREVAPDLSIAFLLSRDFTLTPLAGFVDALRLAADRDDESRPLRCRWTFLSPDGEQRRSSCGLTVTPVVSCAAPASTPDNFDYIAVVGGRTAAMRDPEPGLLAYLRDAYVRTVPLVGLCTGGFLLAAAGLMKGRRCCVHYTNQREFAQRFPDSIPVTDAGFVIDGGIMTCPGSVAAIDVASYLIDRHCSPSRAQKVRNYLLLALQQPGLSLRQRSYEERLAGAHRITQDAVRIMEMNVHRPFPVSEIAQRVNVSVARLVRHFQRDLLDTPAAFWRELRLEQARHLLSDSSRSVTEIAYETGFSDAAHFCKAFRRHANASPQHYRRQSR